MLIIIKNVKSQKVESEKIKYWTQRFITSRYIGPSERIHAKYTLTIAQVPRFPFISGLKVIRITERFINEIKNVLIACLIFDFVSYITRNIFHRKHNVSDKK